MKKYKITPIVHLLRDQNSVKFHIHSDDYFGTIATVLDLIKQQIKKDGRADAAVLNKTLKNLRDDLMFLQENYEIKPRARTGRPAQTSPMTKKKNSRPKGRLMSQ
jgi:hypothetical protein